MKGIDLTSLFPFLGKKQTVITQPSVSTPPAVDTEKILKEAKEEADRIKQEAELKIQKTSQDILEIERKIALKEEDLEKKEQNIETAKKHYEDLMVQLNEKKDEILKKLEKVSGLSKEEAKNLILKAWEDKLRPEIAKKIKEAEEEIKRTVDEKSRELLSEAMRFGASDYVAEYTLSTITLPSDEYKGRIIGKEGRNIRAFEIATGVDVDLEEEGVIKLSSFSSVRREIARVALERLIKDGRIQPERIEEVVAKTKAEVDKVMIKAGEELCHRVGVYNLPYDLVKMLGRFKYRFSYGQNMILHTLEETKIGTALAHELGADVNVVKLGCLLHDIGKVIDDKEGSHIQLGVDLLTKYKLPQSVVDTVASHHEDVPFQTTEAVIVYIADAVSGGRPGARHEDFEEYYKRIKTIEDAAKSQKGVSDAYAVQAGREVRVIVKPEEISDDDMKILASHIKEEIEKKFPTFPGQVNITVVREVRAHTTTHS